MAVVIGDYNRKGGIGKTSSIINIAAELALQGKKILLIDGDSSMNLTQFFFENEGEEIFAEDFERETVFNEEGLIKKGIDTLYSLLAEDLNTYNVIKQCKFKTRRRWESKFKKLDCQLDIILGTEDLDYYDCENVEILKKKLDIVADLYDYIFIDFPPDNSMITMMFLVACDYLISPLHLAKNSSMKGYRNILRRIEEARTTYGNSKLNVLGIFYLSTQLYKSDQKTLYDYTIADEEIREAFKLFRSTIRFDYAAMQTSENEKKPLCICCGNIDIVKDYRTLAKEIEERIEMEGGK